MKYEPRDIRQMKLVTGEEILTEVLGEDNYEFLIRNPLKVHKEKMVVGGVAREANMFTSWMAFSNNEEFVLRKSNIVIESIVSDTVAQHYNSMSNHIIEETDVQVHNPDEEEYPDKLVIDDDGDTPTFH